jgi:hypothetical protein
LRAGLERLLLGLLRLGSRLARLVCRSTSDSRSSLGSRATEPGILPGHDLSIDSSSDPVTTFLLTLFMEMTMAVDVRRGRSLGVTLLLARIEVVHGEFLELEGTTNVNRELIVSC